VFVPGKLFLPSVMIMDKAGAYMSEALFRYYTQVGSSLIHNHYARLEKLKREKQCGLLQTFENKAVQSFITLGLGSHLSVSNFSNNFRTLGVFIRFKMFPLKLYYYITFLLRRQP
jgi:hypothetical protein